MPEIDWRNFPQKIILEEQFFRDQGLAIVVRNMPNLPKEQQEEIATCLIVLWRYLSTQFKLRIKKDLLKISDEVDISAKQIPLEIKEELPEISDKAEITSEQSPLKIFDEANPHEALFPLEAFGHNENPFHVLCGFTVMTSNWAPVPGREGTRSEWNFADHIHFASSAVLAEFFGHTLA